LSANGLGERLAALAVEVGANVQPGQVVTVSATLDHAELVREVAAQAYRRGATFVDVQYYDPLLKRARIQHAPDDSLDYVPPWYGDRVRELGRIHSARIVLASPSDPDTMRGLDPARAGRDSLPAVAEWIQVVDDMTVNWTIIPAQATRSWARLCHPELDEQAAIEKLSGEIAHVCRLDEPDPAAAWNARAVGLASVCAHLNGLRLDAVEFAGPGTELSVGLFPTSTWIGGASQTVDRLRYMANLPTEEVYATPDPNRVEGRVRSRRPLVLIDGTLVTGLHMRFEQGRAVDVEADEGGEVLRGRMARDEGGTRLGEVALVDRESRVGRVGTVFYETLLDENATSHVALGSGYEEGLGEADRPRMNRSSIHIDFMIGGDDVDVTGVTADGRRIPVLRGGAWQF
jgi:aminopeptidase